MKIKDALEYVDELYENVFSEKIKLGWLNQIEMEIQAKVLQRIQEEITRYTQEDMDTHMIAPAPFDRLYPEYLIWRIALAQGELERAANQKTVFDSAYYAFVRHVCKQMDGTEDRAT